MIKVCYTRVLYRESLPPEAAYRQNMSEHVNELRARTFQLRGFVNLPEQVEELCGREGVSVLRIDRHEFDSMDELASSAVWNEHREYMNQIRERLYKENSKA